MEMHQVRYFLALSRTLNFTQAAAECHVTQPALTRAIKKLEEELGGPLVHRERDHTHLTHLGKMVLPFLEQVYNSSAAARALAEGLRRGERAPLAIGVTDSLDKRVLLSPIREIRGLVNGLELRIEGGSDADLSGRLLSGDLDVAVFDRAAIREERLRFCPLYQEDMKVMMVENHPLSEGADVELTDLLAEHWITTAGSRPHEQFAECMRELEPGWTVRHHAARPTEAQVLVLSDLGLGLVGDREPVLAGLTTRPISGGPPPSREVGVAVAQARQSSYACEALVRLLRAQAYDLTN